MGLAGEQRGGVADVELRRRECRLSGSAECGFHAFELIVGDTLVGFVGGKEMGHYTFEAQGGLAMKAREKRGQRFGITPWRLMPVSISR